MFVLTSFSLPKKYLAVLVNIHVMISYRLMAGDANSGKKRQNKGHMNVLFHNNGIEILNLYDIAGV